ncbi:MFS transporter [Prosthecodimorpha staleyi]|uniref:MFS transporter n=1 Tax=Prosthecodimorpha staleyi TaxID=2840188 RepID=A0A947DC19_9HYPH|nr:MFS transporter [Prosthecodimorpha staleyi]MBT9293122.1 MFS transporter [Prosthecodimorpha staleyi]
MQGIWANREFRFYLASVTVQRFAASALLVLLGYQVYALRKEPLDLAALGLAEALPGITLVLYGGHLADILNRRLIVIACAAALTLLAGGLALASAAGPTLAFLLAVAFMAASVKAFQTPATTGLEAQVLPVEQIFAGIPTIAMANRSADIVGPAAMGFVWAAAGPSAAYAVLAGLFALVLGAVSFGIAPKPTPERPARPVGAVTAIREGIAFVFGNQVLVGSMALDLFAVFFGGAAALLPVFATDILQVGPTGFGVLRAAAAAGSLTAALAATRFLPKAHAGLALHGIIAGFGLSMIVFGLSESFLLSLAALFVSGLCDGMSVVIRQSIVRLASPEHLRGRIAAVRMVFIGSSNELGAVESGLAAAWLGPARAVWAGGVVTLAVVAAVSRTAPRLVALDLNTFGRPAAPATPTRA